MYIQTKHVPAHVLLFAVSCPRAIIMRLDIKVSTSFEAFQENLKNNFPLHFSEWLTLLCLDFHDSSNRDQLWGKCPREGQNAGVGVSLSGLEWFRILVVKGAGGSLWKRFKWRPRSDLASCDRRGDWLTHTLRSQEFSSNRWLASSIEAAPSTAVSGGQ